MSLVPAYVCLGSNSDNAAAMLAAAVRLLGASWQVARVSSIYLTEPQNLKAQPWFNNQVVKLFVEPGHLAFMRELLALESALGRKRSGPRFGPRLIDIDLLLFGDVVSADPVCLLPHPRLAERAFALLPLLEIEPRIIIQGKPVRYWLGQIEWRQEGNLIFQ